MRAAGLVVAGGAIVLIIEPFGPAAASGSLPAVGSPITLPASTLPMNPTTSTTAACAHPKQGCSTTFTAPPTTAPPPSRPVATTPTPSPTAAPPSGFSGGGGSAVGVSSVTTVPAKPPTAKKAKSKAHAAPLAANGVYNEPMVLANGGWKGLSLKAATNLKVPILFGLAVALFVLIQALIDRRDPKVSRAPERGDEETVGFE